MARPLLLDPLFQHSFFLNPMFAHPVFANLLNDLTQTTTTQIWRKTLHLEPGQTRNYRLDRCRTVHEDAHQSQVGDDPSFGC